MIQRLNEIKGLIKGIPGELAEIGVYNGDSFVHLVRIGKEQQRKVYAFDSFVGMGDPGPYDGDQYPAGRFNVGGVEGFQKIMVERFGVDPTDYHCLEGFIPDCLGKFIERHPRCWFALAFLDVDHYEPTLEALRWLEYRIYPTGFLVLDDYLPHINKGFLATRAIDEWLATAVLPFETWCYEFGQLILRRRPVIF